jgi:hypothetical protein
VGPSVFMGESVGLQMNTWGPWGSRCSWRNVGGEAPHTVSTISLKVFPGPCGRPSLKKPHPTTKPYCLQVPGLPVSIALREYQIRHGFQRPRATWGPWGSRCSWRNVGGEAPHTVSTIYLKVFPGPCGRPSLKRIHPKKKPYCLQVSGLPVSIALRVYQNRHGFQSLRARTAPELVEGTSGRSQHRR